MIKIKEMLDAQNALQVRIYKERLGKDFENMSELAEQEVLDLLYENIYFLDEELHEMGRELPYMKHWKTYANSNALDLSKAREEFIDAWHFMLNIALVMNIQEDVLKTAISNSPYGSSLSFIRNQFSEVSAANIKYLILDIASNCTELIDFYKQYAEVGYGICVAIVQSMLDIAVLLQMLDDDINNVYFAKNKINHERQDNNY